MPPCRPHSVGRYRFALAAALVGGGMLWFAAGAVATGGPSEPGRFERPQPGVIRAEMDRILSDRRFDARAPLMQRFWDWLWGWQERHLTLSGGWSKFLLWLITVWCVLTLLAILGHIIWTIVVAFRGRARRASAGRGPPAAQAGAQAWSYAQLCAKMRRLADRGAYRQAVALMMVALLRLLDQARVVRFDKSKTNREYLRECSSSFAKREAFARFVLTFDAAIYGGASCDRHAYDVMHAMFERLRNDRRAKP